MTGGDRLSYGIKPVPATRLKRGAAGPKTPSPGPDDPDCSPAVMTRSLIE